MRKNVKYDWIDECELSFQELKQRLVSALVLIIPSGDGGFVIFSDAFKKGLGCVLMQQGRERIKTAQKKDEELVEVIEGVQSELKPDFNIFNDGILKFHSRVCVLNNVEIKQVILEEAHCSLYTVHPGSTEMYQTLRNLFGGRT
ncbi:uncharacterized protein LOC131151214 [Malania oleifera]|uniref:uncharacterized protein LOC131151214 n=1 Tax=Malania oleifera TaxID=397392 RepID=UPI0025AE7936|nr:uncharacterized protein LOC131151214 [Malania oleifera]